MAGCVGLRDLGSGVCEMKRMFVATEHQGHGLGTALGVRFLAEAAAAGYRLARLDTVRSSTKLTGSTLGSGSEEPRPTTSSIRRWRGF